MQHNHKNETVTLLANVAKNITTVPMAAAAPTKAEFDALATQFNALVTALKAKNPNL